MYIIAAELIPLKVRVSLFNGLNYWTELLDWTTGLTFLSLKIFILSCN